MTNTPDTSHFNSSYLTPTEDSFEGDISIPHPHFNPNSNEYPSASDLEEPNEDEDSLRQSSLKNVFVEPISPKPRGYTFQLKATKAAVYLTYPIETVEVDTYGKITSKPEHLKSNTMVILIPNSKGLSINNQKLADAYSVRTGCVVALLDIYFGDPLTLDKENNDVSTWIGKFRRMSIDFSNNTHKQFWFQSHQVFGKYLGNGTFQASSNFKKIKKALKELINSHGVNSCVLVGFSYGCNVVGRLSLEIYGQNSREWEQDDDIKEKIKSVVMIHPIQYPPNLFDLLPNSEKKTLYIFSKGNEVYSDTDLLHWQTEFEKSKEKNGTKLVELKVKQDTPSGFAIYGDYPPLKTHNFPSLVCDLVVKWVLETII